MFLKSHLFFYINSLHLYIQSPSTGIFIIDLSKECVFTGTAIFAQNV